MRYKVATIPLSDGMSSVFKISNSVYRSIYVGN